MRYISSILLLAFAIPIAASAQLELESEERKIVPEGVVISEDYAVAGETVEISGTIKGDTYVAGGQIFINGTIDGDLLAIGGTITISGSVTQNVRVIGGQVLVSGTIGRNVTIAAMNANFTDSAEVKGGIVVGGSNVLIAGSVDKDAKIAGRTLNITGSIEEDVEAAVETIRLTSDAEIGGDFTYWSNREAFIDESASVSGTLKRKSPQELPGKLGGAVTSVQSLLKPFLEVVSFFTTFILGVALFRFFPSYSEAVVDTLRRRRWRSLTSGITALLLIPLLFGLLIITIVGIPLGFVLLFISSLILYTARIFVMLLIGRLLIDLLRGKSGLILAFFVGLLVYTLLVQIPVVGWAVSFLAALFGVGAAVQTLKERVQKS